MTPRTTSGCRPYNTLITCCAIIMKQLTVISISVKVREFAELAISAVALTEESARRGVSVLPVAKLATRRSVTCPRLSTREARLLTVPERLTLATELRTLAKTLPSSMRPSHGYRWHETICRRSSKEYFSGRNRRKGRTKHGG